MLYQQRIRRNNGQGNALAATGLGAPETAEPARVAGGADVPRSIQRDDFG